MAFTFDLPEVGEGVVEAEIVAWKVKVGDVVRVDQPLCEITTDKAQLEISSPKAGTISAVHGQPGDIVKVHSPLCVIDESAVGSSGGQAPAAQAPAPVSNGHAPPKAAPAPKAAAPAPKAPVAAPRPAAPAPRAPVEGPARAAPAVRRHAKEADVDIHQVPGTGKSGRVTHEDVAAYANGAQPFLPPALPQVHSGEDERIKIIGVRRKIAQQMVKAKQSAPHFTYVEEIDVTELVRVRERLKKGAEARGVKLTYIPFIVKACSVAFRDFPNVNALLDDESYELVVRKEHNIGIATDTPNGLFVPVIKNVELKSILQVAWEIGELSERTRAGKASLDELRGGTFTVTSVGNIGGVLATPILNVPEVAIMGVNAIRDRAMVVGGQVVARKMLNLSPSFDHRIIDGAVAARFVARVKELLEAPESMLLELA
jgi:pyruvate/2-oxoglutarate dehydrogenase complex dihydrolipoamide acyltransferase (E2) component